MAGPNDRDRGDALALGAWNTPLAMLIGATKSTLIVLWFTHLVEHRTSARVALAVAVGLALCLIAFTVLDVRTRRPAQPAGTTDAATSAVWPSPNERESGLRG